MREPGNKVVPLGILSLPFAVLFSFFHAPFFSMHPNQLNTWKRLLPPLIRINQVKFTVHTQNLSWTFREGLLEKDSS